MEEYDGDWMKVTVDSNLQSTIILDNRRNAVWNATREIIQTYAVPYFKPLPPPGSASPAEGEAGAASAEIPPWMRKRGGGWAETGLSVGLLVGHVRRRLMGGNGAA
jgi:hypothetical protein